MEGERDAERVKERKALCTTSKGTHHRNKGQTEAHTATHTKGPNELSKPPSRQLDPPDEPNKGILQSKRPLEDTSRPVSHLEPTVAKETHNCARGTTEEVKGATLTKPANHLEPTPHDQGKGIQNTHIRINRDFVSDCKDKTTKGDTSKGPLNDSNVKSTTGNEDRGIIKDERLSEANDNTPASMKDSSKGISKGIKDNQLERRIAGRDEGMKDAKERKDSEVKDFKGLQTNNNNNNTRTLTLPTAPPPPFPEPPDPPKGYDVAASRLMQQLVGETREVTPPTAVPDGDPLLRSLPPPKASEYKVAFSSRPRLARTPPGSAGPLRPSSPRHVLPPIARATHAHPRAAT